MNATALRLADVVRPKARQVVSDVAAGDVDRAHVDALLHEADRMLTGDLALTGGWWPRTTVFVLRSALELELGAYWEAVAPALAGRSLRTQLAVLRRPEHGGGDAGSDVAAASAALGRALDQQDAGSVPAVAELLGCLDAVRAAAAGLRRLAGDRAAAA